MKAYNIHWETDGDLDVFLSLPNEIKIPDGMVDEDEISDYISDQTGWCHYRLDVLEGCEDNPVYRKEIQEIRKELSEIQEYIKTELF